MKNFEKYDLNTLGINVCTIMYRRLFGGSCKNKECNDCPLETSGKFIEWSNEEYIEPIHLTHDEYVILKNVNKVYKFIARKDNNVVRLYESKPYKEPYDWYHGGLSTSLDPLDHLFQFIQWSNDEPYEIAKLIEDYEKENEDE